MNAIRNDCPVLSLSSRETAYLMEAVIERGVPFRFRAAGKSMAPSIRDGDVVTISPLLRGEPRVGQVVACRLPETGRLVVHRVRRKKNGRALIRGDRVGVADGWVSGEDILGVVTALERDGRRCFWPWKRTGGRLAFLVLAKLQFTRVLRGLRRRVKGMIRNEGTGNASR